MNVHCPNCKAPITIASEKNCTHCGVVLPAAVVEAAKAAADSNGGESAAGGLAGFVAENWIWIVGPIVFAIVVLLVIVFVFGGGDDTSPFIYSIF